MRDQKTQDEPLGFSYGPYAMSQTASELKNFNSFTIKQGKNFGRVSSLDKHAVFFQMKDRLKVNLIEKDVPFKHK